MLNKRLNRLASLLIATTVIYSSMSTSVRGESMCMTYVSAVQTSSATVSTSVQEGTSTSPSTITESTSTVGVTELYEVFRLSNKNIAYRAGKSTDVISNLEKYSLTESKLNDPVLYFILNGSIENSDPLEELSIRQSALYVVNDSSFDLTKIDKSTEFKNKVTALVTSAKEYKEIMFTGNFIKSVYTQDDLVTDSKGETKLITLPNLLGVSYSVKSISDGSKVVNNWGNPIDGEVTSFKVKSSGSFKLVLSCKVTNFTLRYVKSTEPNSPSLITSDSSDTFNKDIEIEKLVSTATPSTSTPINFNYNLDITGLEGEHVEGIKIGLFKDGDLVKELLTSSSTLTETITKEGVYEWRVIEMDNARYYIPDSNISIVRVDKSADRFVTLEPSEKSKFDFKSKTVGSIYEVKSATPSVSTSSVSTATTSTVSTGTTSAKPEGSTPTVTSDSYALGFVVLLMTLAGFLEFFNRVILKRLKI